MQGLSILITKHTPIAVFLATLLALVFCTCLQAKQATPSNEARWHSGCELFQMLIEERGVSNLQSLNASLNSPLTSVVVLTDELRSYPREFWPRLVKFVEKGGSVLIASDQSCLMSGIGEIKQGPVVSRQSEDIYLEHKDCLRIQQLNTEHPLMVGVKQIISNRTGWLVLPSEPSALNPLRWQTIASIPHSSSPVTSRDGPLIVMSDSSTKFAGVMVIVADTSILTNGMLWHGDNAAFAIRLSETLCRGSKTHMTFMSGGQTLSTYKDRIEPPKPSLDSKDLPSPGTAELPSTDLDTALQVVNQVLKSVEDSNILNEAMANQPRPVNPRGYALAVLVMLTVAGVLILPVFKMLNNSWQAAFFVGYLPDNMHKCISYSCCCIIFQFL